MSSSQKALRRAQAHTVPIVMTMFCIDGSAGRAMNGTLRLARVVADTFGWVETTAPRMCFQA
ncbi:hypothetical protein BJF84_22260 [Rhodococcus sp. CUA-806]|nr:hypothetical protein BJF84_22260 [Rhodococcus sp. CUA-806]